MRVVVVVVVVFCLFVCLFVFHRPQFTATVISKFKKKKELVYNKSKKY